MLGAYPAYGVAMSEGPDPIPVTNPDLRATKNGSFYIALTYAKGTQAILVLNSRDLWPLKSMVENVPAYIGDIEAGEGLRFYLKTGAELCTSSRYFRSAGGCGRSGWD